MGGKHGCSHGRCLRQLSAPRLDLAQRQRSSRSSSVLAGNCPTVHPSNQMMAVEPDHSCTPRVDRGAESSFIAAVADATGEKGNGQKRDLITDMALMRDRIAGSGAGRSPCTSPAAVRDDSECSTGIARKRCNASKILLGKMLFLSHVSRLAM